MRWKTSLILFAAAMISHSFAMAADLAGAANALLECRSTDGVTIKGEVPGDFAEFDMSIQKGDKTARLFSVLNQRTGQLESNATIAIVQDLKNGVWTLVSEQTAKAIYGHLELYALPKSVKFHRRSNGYQATFKGKLSADLPDLQAPMRQKSVSCSLNYEI